jgi:hypothetical protein
MYYVRIFSGFFEVLYLLLLHRDSEGKKLVIYCLKTMGAYSNTFTKI